MRLLLYYSYLAPQFLLVAALVLLLRRDLYKKYPFFGTSIVFQLVYFTAGLGAYLWALSDPPRLTQVYQWVVTFGLAVGSLFEFAVLYEISDHILLSRLKSSGSFRPFLRWTAAILLLAGSVGSALLARTDLNQAVTTFQTLNFSVNVVKIGFLLALLLLTKVLDISWGGLSAGIALGFGIAGTAEMGASALISAFASVRYVVVDLIRMAGFQMCVLVWIAYTFRYKKIHVSTENNVPLSGIENHLEEIQRIAGRR